MDRNQYNSRILGPELYSKVASSRVLMVGAGGIGCELLKNLVLSGFNDICVIDLDTIDISNLNRQFLFQRQHVKQAKAHVAKESALRFNPSVRIESIQANIKDPQFSPLWFAGFTLVFNALDNLDARRHVNQMCLVANVPLIESGTMGYLGQAYVIKKDVTECFDCFPKPTPTTYPVCTIRSTPSEPIHCIVWAKSYLFTQLFGVAETDEVMTETPKDNAKELAALARETEELKEIKNAVGTEDYPKKVFEKVFTKDIERLLTMEEMWTFREKPTPLDYDTLSKMPDEQPLEEGGLKDQAIWTLPQCLRVFKESVVKLAGRGMIFSFDKDDDDALDFVTATANLRAHVFNIPQKSRFEIKSMAGNIIPAIATTNAIIAGVAVMKGFAVLRGPINAIKRTYLSTVSRRPPLLLLEAPSEPNPYCTVCRAPTVLVRVDFERATVQDLLTYIITAPTESMGAAMPEEDVVIMHGNNVIYDYDFQDNLTSSLAKDLNIKPGDILRVASDDGEVDLVLETDTTIKNPVMITIPITLKTPPPPRTEEILETAGAKRSIEDSPETEAKKLKSTDNVILIEEEEGAILID